MLSCETKDFPSPGSPASSVSLPSAIRPGHNHGTASGATSATRTNTGATAGSGFRITAKFAIASTSLHSSAGSLSAWASIQSRFPTANITVVEVPAAA